MIETMFNTLMYYFQGIGVIVMILTYIYDRKQIAEIDLGGMAKFVGLMVFITLVRLAMWEGSASPETFGHTLGSFKFVFLEDAFFVMIPYYINKKVNSKFLKWSVWIFFSGLFASGHLYQGLMGFAITAVYPYFISNKYAKKTTFATVMACHFMFDCFAVLGVKMHGLLRLLERLGI